MGAALNDGSFPPLISDSTFLLRENSPLCLYPPRVHVGSTPPLLLLHNNGLGRCIKGCTGFTKMRGYSPLLPLISRILLLMSVN